MQELIGSIEVLSDKVNALSRELHSITTTNNTWINLDTILGAVIALVGSIFVSSW